MKEAIQKDCSHYGPGIETISVCVIKPNIPDSIKRNFELMEKERTKGYTPCGQIICYNCVPCEHPWTVYTMLST